MYSFNTIEEALDDLRAGRLILATDDPDRENEGDFICAAQFATTENVNFMATHGKGLICMPMSLEYVQRLRLPQMVAQNTDNHETAFTVSIDHVSTTTGISAAERSITAMKCVEEGARPEDFRRPGHMFPLLARKNGVLERNGHTEATVDLLRLAGLKECGLCCEIMREDGTMMRTGGDPPAHQIRGLPGLRLCEPPQRGAPCGPGEGGDRRRREPAVPGPLRVPHRGHLRLPPVRLRGAAGLRPAAD